MSSIGENIIINYFRIEKMVIEKNKIVGCFKIKEEIEDENKDMFKISFFHEKIIKCN